MGIERFFVHDVTILRASEVDGRHGPELDWSDPAETTTRGWVALGRPQQNEWAGGARQAGRDMDVSQWVAMLPADADVREQDRLEVNLHGRTYLFEVAGHIAPGSTPDGISHLEAPLLLVEG